MTKKMLIDATHAEETRVAVVDGDRLEEFDYESEFRKPLKGSIFLAKVTRVEPSLQAAFVNFGGNRHGFLPFSEIHPDYYRIPIADREALIAEQEELLRKAQEEQEKEEEEKKNNKNGNDDDDAADNEEPEEVSEDGDDDGDDEYQEEAEASDNDEEQSGNNDDKGNGNRRRRGRRGGRNRYGNRHGRKNKRAAHNNSNKVEILGGTEYDEEENNIAEKARFALRRKYKIQEVIKRGQIVLVQVSREERGNKGAAVSTYLSLPGRYGVLMPNSPRSGGVSRKISSHQDRKKLRDMLKSFDIPQGMSVILRTAGVSRTKTEIKRDIDYLMRLWNDIRELTLNSSAPALIYEEADLLKRAVRDLYTRDIDEIFVSGEEGHKKTKKFMKMMIPSHAARVKLYKETDIPLFHRYQVEHQISEIGEPTATMKSGGYLVINPTEALVSIDVNSGRATKERHIEETALKTNLEAADEVARQLRLRDLGGLIVVDFIDMEDRRNNGKVERRLKEALSNDRARIQIGRISSFGLLEMSRQRLNPSVTEAQFETCKACNGLGNVRTSDATAITLLRSLEEEGIKKRAAEVIAHVSNRTALYMLNYKRKHIEDIENLFQMKVLIRVDDDLGPDHYRIEVSKPAQQNDNDTSDSQSSSENQKDKDKDENNNKDNQKSRRQNNKRQGSNNRSAQKKDHEDKDHHDKGGNEDGKDDKPDNTKVSDKDDDSSDKKSSGKRQRRSSPRKKQETEKDKSGNSEDKKDKAAGKDDAKETSDNKAKADQKSPAKTAEDKADKNGGKKDEKAGDQSAKSDAKDDTKEAPAKNDNDNDQRKEKEYEVVNAAPKKPKKGWWNKLLDQ